MTTCAETGHHYEGCACREERWQRVARELARAYLSEVTAARLNPVVEVPKRMRAIGLCGSGDGRWEFVDEKGGA